MKKTFLFLILFFCLGKIFAQDKIQFYQDKVYGDVYLKNLNRGAGGRTLTPSADNSLTINFAHDFSGGVHIGGWGDDNDLAIFNIKEKFPIRLNGKLKIKSAYVEGKIGIGVENPISALEVNGTIRSKEVKIEATEWSDFVFNKDYELLSLQAVEEYINDKGHLPNIPSEKEIIENGVNVVEMQAKLLQKIEELTLYVIDLKKENESVKQKLKELNKK